MDPIIAGGIGFVLGLAFLGVPALIYIRKLNGRIEDYWRKETLENNDKVANQNKAELVASTIKSTVIALGYLRRRINEISYSDKTNELLDAIVQDLNNSLISEVDSNTALSNLWFETSVQLADRIRRDVPIILKLIKSAKIDEAEEALASLLKHVTSQ